MGPVQHDVSTKCNCMLSLVELVVALNNAMEQWSYFTCIEIKSDALTIATVDQ